MAEDLSNYIKKTDYATQSTAGVVKVDGNTIAVDGLGELKVHNLKQFYPVIATYVNGASGYRIWADGYCEQWGHIAVADDATSTITFAKTWRDINYTIVCGIIDGQLGGSNFRYPSFVNSAVNSIQVAGQSNCGGSGQGWWRAFGYLAQGQY